MNHPETISPTPVCEKIVFHETGPESANKVEGYPAQGKVGMGERSGGFQINPKAET